MHHDYDSRSYRCPHCGGRREHPPWPYDWDQRAWDHHHHHHRHESWQASYANDQARWEECRCGQFGQFERFIR